MADPKGFLTTPRETPARRPVDVRLPDWREVYEPFPPSRLERQAGRCMDCGIPFCHHGCPLGNLIPEWNDLVWRHDWREAADRLHATNNFPEFTGRLCPVGCQKSAWPVSCSDDQGQSWGIMIIRVSPPALSHLRLALRLAGPARPVVGLQGRRALRTAA